MANKMQKTYLELQILITKPSLLNKAARIVKPNEYGTYYLQRGALNRIATIYFKNLLNDIRQ